MGSIPLLLLLCLWESGKEEINTGRWRWWKKGIKSETEEWTDGTRNEVIRREMRGERGMLWYPREKGSSDIDEEKNHWCHLPLFFSTILCPARSIRFIPGSSLAAFSRGSDRTSTVQDWGARAKGSFSQLLQFLTSILFFPQLHCNKLIFCFLCKIQQTRSVSEGFQVQTRAYRFWIRAPQQPLGRYPRKR